jgi:general secretion pathway protein E
MAVTHTDTEPAPEAERDEQLARHLVDSGRLSEAALDRARRVGDSTGEALPGLLLKLGLLSERDLAEALAHLHGITVVQGEDYPAVALYEDRLSPRFLREARVLPLHVDEQGLHLAMADPGDNFAREAMSLVANVQIHAYAAVPAELEQAIERLYGDSAGRLDAEDGDTALEDGLDTDIERLKDLASEAPVVRFVNRTITHAIDMPASPIHLDPF